MDRDRLGRKRQPEQSRGLRPLHPELPEEWFSRAIRVAMSEADWALFSRLVAALGSAEPTQARSYGRTLSELMHLVAEHSQETRTNSLAWMDWESKKALRLLMN